MQHAPRAGEFDGGHATDGAEFVYSQESQLDARVPKFPHFLLSTAILVDMRGAHDSSLASHICPE